jgi:hypothetical protein
MMTKAKQHFSSENNSPHRHEGTKKKKLCAFLGDVYIASGLFSFAIFLALFLALSVFARGLSGQEGYPGQLQPTPTLTQPQPESYPPNPPNEEIAPTVPGLTGEAGREVDSEAALSTPLDTDLGNPQAIQGLYYLWGGFTAALFILATSVYGAITLFIRRKD